MLFNIGDLVTRNSYNNDIVFKIVDIDNDIAILEGVDIRLSADSKLDDLKKEMKVESDDDSILDRFDSNNLVWSYQTPKDGFNIKYSIGVQYPSWVDDFKGLERNDGGNYIPEATVFRKAVSAYQRISENIVLFDVVIWRFGFTLSLLLLAFYYTIIRKIKVIPVYLPTLISVLFWIALMSHQDYRYLWFMFVNTFFLIIFTLMEKKKIK